MLEHDRAEATIPANIAAHFAGITTLAAKWDINEAFQGLTLTNMDS